MPARLRGRPEPPLVAATVSSEVVGLLLAAPREDAATGFDSIDDGMTWVIERSALAAVAAPPARRVPWPLLVPLGHVKPQGPLVLVNLEHFGVVDVMGEPADVEVLAETVATAVAADHLGAAPLMICVNSGWQLSGVSGVRVAGSLQDVLEDVERHRARLGASARSRRDQRGQRLPVSQRIPPPLVVIDPHTRDRELRNRLRALAGEGLAVVAAATGGDGSPRRVRGEPRWALEVSGCDVRWHPIGVDLHLAGCGRESLPELSADIRHRRCDAGVSGGGSGGRRAGTDLSGDTVGASRPYDEHDSVMEPTGAVDSTDPSRATPGPVELQVLGVVRVTGGQSPFTSQRALDLACYLAFHRDGATADRLRYWLWSHSEPPPSHKSFSNVVSRARVCLGRDSNGEPYLSHLGADGVYRLSRQVTTDLDRFTAWRRAAEKASPSQALACLVAALSIVRGAPFGGGTGGTFSWADASWRGHVEYLVDSTVHWLADVALDLGRIGIARGATLRGLAITPDCDQCYQRRMTAARRSGDRREMSAVMHHMHRLDTASDLILDDRREAPLDGPGGGP